MFFEICKDNRCDDETLEEIILRRVRPFLFSKFSASESIDVWLKLQRRWGPALGLSLIAWMDMIDSKKKVNSEDF